MSSNRKSSTIVQIILVSAIFGALTFVVAFAGGIVITSTFGPGTSGVFTIIITNIVVVSGGMLLPKFGTLFGINIVFSILAIPTTLFGPIGPAKIVIGIVTGFLYEIIIALFRSRNKLSFAVAGSVSAAVSVFVIYVVTGLTDATVSNTLERFLFAFAGVYAVLGAIGGVVGVVVFQRYVSDMSLVKYLSGKSKAANHQSGPHDND